MAVTRSTPTGWVQQTKTLARATPIGWINETVAAAAPASTATLPAGLGAMGSGKTRASQSAGLSYMG